MRVYFGRRDVGRVTRQTSGGDSCCRAYDLFDTFLSRRVASRTFLLAVSAFWSCDDATVRDERATNDDDEDDDFGVAGVANAERETVPIVVVVDDDKGGG